MGHPATPCPRSLGCFLLLDYSLSSSPPSPRPTLCVLRMLRSRHSKLGSCVCFLFCCAVRTPACICGFLFGFFLDLSPLFLSAPCLLSLRSDLPCHFSALLLLLRSLALSLSLFLFLRASFTISLHKSSGCKC